MSVKGYDESMRRIAIELRQYETLKELEGYYYFYCENDKLYLPQISLSGGHSITDNKNNNSYCSNKIYHYSDKDKKFEATKTLEKLTEIMRFIETSKCYQIRRVKLFDCETDRYKIYYGKSMIIGEQIFDTKISFNIYSVYYQLNIDKNGSFKRIIITKSYFEGIGKFSKIKSDFFINFSFKQNEYYQINGISPKTYLEETGDIWIRYKVFGRDKLIVKIL